MHKFSVNSEAGTESANPHCREQLSRHSQRQHPPLRTHRQRPRRLGDRVPLTRPLGDLTFCNRTIGHASKRSCRGRRSPSSIALTASIVVRYCVGMSPFRTADSPASENGERDRSSASGSTSLGGRVERGMSAVEGDEVKSKGKKTHCPCVCSSKHSAWSCPGLRACHWSKPLCTELVSGCRRQHGNCR